MSVPQHTRAWANGHRLIDTPTVVTVPTPDGGQLRAIAASFYEECNEARRSLLPASIGMLMLDRLLETNPRGIREAIAEATTRAAAERRCALRADVVGPAPPRRQIGFR